MTFGTTTDPVVEPTVEAPTSTETPVLPDDIQKKITHQDAHIAKLEKEAVERDNKLIAILEKQAGQVETAQNKQDLITMIEDLKTANVTTQEPSPNQEISIDEIVGTVGDRLKEQALEAKRATNLEASIASAKEAYGDDKFDTEIVRLANEKGMSLDSVNDMAKNNPQVFKELFLPAATRKSIDLGTTVHSSGLDPSTVVAKKSITKMNSKARGAYVQSLIDNHPLNT